MDTGLADILGEPKVISPAAIVIYDLNTDKLIKRYTFKSEDLKQDSFFANIVSILLTQIIGILKSFENRRCRLGQSIVVLSIRISMLHKSRKHYLLPNQLISIRIVIIHHKLHIEHMYFKVADRC